MLNITVKMDAVLYYNDCTPTLTRELQEPVLGIFTNYPK